MSIEQIVSDLRAISIDLAAVDRMTVELASQEIERLSAELDDYRSMVSEWRDLVRRLDIALNGDGAAKQASLCDLVSQFEKH